MLINLEKLTNLEATCGDIQRIKKFHEGIMKILNSINACYHSLHDFLSSRLPPRKEIMKMYKSKVLPIVWVLRTNIWM